MNLFKVMFVFFLVIFWLSLMVLMFFGCAWWFGVSFLVVFGGF